MNFIRFIGQLVRRLPFFGAGVLFLFTGCKDDPDIPVQDIGYQLVVPEHFPEPWYQSERNKLTPAGVSLGRKLFYDPLLSRDGSISCGSCHHQEAGFSDPGMAFSLGVDGKKGLRNSTALANLAWMPSFMADGGINHIEVMSIAPLTDSLEMDEDLLNILHKLKDHQQYPQLFKQAFNSDTITDQLMLFALAQFMSTMVSANSKYDRVYLGQEQFSTAESRGYQLFQNNCAGCHREPLLTDFSFRNNGLDSVSADPGRTRITLREEDRGKFKVPGLRNIELTGPYMHDGRFSDLMSVIEHYNQGLANPANLDPELQKPMHLTPQDKNDLAAFLRTLTDYEYITRPSLSDPKQ